MSDPVIVPPTIQIHAIAETGSLNSIVTSYMYELTVGAFVVPSYLGTASLTVGDSSHYAVNGYVWIYGGGWFKITSRVNDTVIALTNYGFIGNADEGTIIAVGTVFIHTPPPMPLWLEAEATWNPAEIADAGFEAKDISLSGAALGDFVIASFSLDLEDMILSASVTAANTVTAVLVNNTGGAVDLASGTVRVRIMRNA